MRYILLLGAALNFAGSAKILGSAIPPAAGVPPDYLQFKLFTCGVAAVFGALYLYLFFHAGQVIPFLVFGAALKTWALLLSLYLYWKQQMGMRALIEFGISNGVVAALFWFYILDSV